MPAIRKHHVTQEFYCTICGETHRYMNPSQFAMWTSRHRKKFHADYRGTIKYKRTK